MIAEPALEFRLNVDVDAVRRRRQLGLLALERAMVSSMGGSFLRKTSKPPIAARSGGGVTAFACSQMSQIPACEAGHQDHAGGGGDHQAARRRALPPHRRGFFALKKSGSATKGRLSR